MPSTTTAEAIAQEGRKALDRARLAFEDPYAGARALAERGQARDAHMEALMRKVSDGGRKLISPRDLHAEAFAQIDAQARKWSR